MGKYHNIFSSTYFIDAPIHAICMVNIPQLLWFKHMNIFYFPTHLILLDPEWKDLDFIHFGRYCPWSLLGFNCFWYAVMSFWNVDILKRIKELVLFVTKDFGYYSHQYLSTQLRILLLVTSPVQNSLGTLNSTPHLTDDNFGVCHLWIFVVIVNYEHTENM